MIGDAASEWCAEPKNLQSLFKVLHLSKSLCELQRQKMPGREDHDLKPRKTPTEIQTLHPQQSSSGTTSSKGGGSKIPASVWTSSRDAPGRKPLAQHRPHWTEATWEERQRQAEFRVTVTGEKLILEKNASPFPTTGRGLQTASFHSQPKH